MNGGFLAGSIIATLTLDKGKWDAAVRDVKADSEKLKKGLGGVGQVMSDVGRNFTIAGGIIFGTLSLMVKSTASVGDELYKLSQKTGISVESLSGLRYSATLANVSLQELSVGLKILQGNIVEAITKGGEAKEAFTLLGISVTDSAGQLRSTESILYDIADRFAELEDGTEKTALAVKLFGRSGADLIPLLNQGSEGLKRNREEAERLGLVFSKQAAKSCEDFKDSLSDLRFSFSGLVKELVINLMPVATELIKDIKEIIVKVRQWTEAHPGLTKAIAEFAFKFGGLMAVVGPALIAITKLISMFKGLGLALAGVTSPAGLASVALAGVSLIIADLIRRHKDALDEMSGFQKRASVDIDRFSRDLSMAEFAAIKAGGEALEQLKKLKERFGSDLAGMFIAITEDPSYGEFKKIFDETKARLAITATAGQDLASVNIKLSSSLSDLAKRHRELGESIEGTKKGLISESLWLKEEENKVQVKVRSINQLLPAHRDLADVISLVPTAIESEIYAFKEAVPPARDFADIMRYMPSVIEYTAKRIPYAFEKIDWSFLSEDISRYWLTGIADMIAGTQSFADVVKNTFSIVASGVGSGISKLVSGALSSIGSMAGPIGSIVGGIAASVVSLGAKLLGIKSKAEKEAEERAKREKEEKWRLEDIKKSMSEYGKISDSTAQKIRELEEGSKGYLAVSKAFADIIRDVGVTQSNVNKLWSRAIDIIGQFRGGELKADEATKALSDSFSELLEGTRALGLEGSRLMVDFIKQVRESGLQVESVAKYVNEQLNRIPAALTKMAAAAGTSSEKLQETGLIALASFNAMVQSGKSWMETIQALREPLASLKAKYTEIGLAAEPSLAELFKVVDITEGHKELFEAIDANREILEALGNTGFLTAETMSILAKNATDYYNQLQAAGVSADTAIKMMGPTLQSLYNYSVSYGVSLDENTQALIDQAKAMGLVKEVQADMGEIMSDIRDILNDIRDILKGPTKEATEDWFKGLSNVKSQAEGIAIAMKKASEIEFGFGEFAPVVGAQKGFSGIVTKPHLFLAGEAGPERVLIKPVYSTESSAQTSIVLNFNIDGVGDLRSVIKSQVLPVLQECFDRYLIKIPAGAVGR